MKKKSIVLQLRKSKVANLHTIYGGGTNTCDSLTVTTDDTNPDPEPPKSEDADSCSGSGRNDSINNSDIC